MYQQNHILFFILSAARNEFLGKGFEDASMRTIAQKAEVGLRKASPRYP